ncbi:MULTISPECIES: hypothetical protein [unclassified Tolypothrix]|uniref:hypothetical protein n=1 Tax=unclassified Tolypothrix TaxID=2649714 RepID=UPI0005EAB8FA|nr:MULTISPECIES: hypothetical protein [unclassified Tolypothrix]BAY94707.1 hypothetical protein NIES3275_67590 [Microchaete diplosiphon NIES-3275]EKE99060.1 hypothetical protein FDUTEX481_03252 [Tolypothrix sp. PCC 7601]MBE9081381.1 hypothetical protein [Tolypothrix sp. LEGE 11397]UYD28400.1 hypothetical protein HGR01_10360 [Tolypothrix sp. PCC 7712]UYD35722.1 hypothetical protein HG267_08205 [Tolypothrix sp. PCC 7601]
MTQNNSDKDIELLIIGKWQYEYQGFAYHTEFKRNLTYELNVKGDNLITQLAMGFLSQQFYGGWYVKDSTVYLMDKQIPNSSLNLDSGDKISIGGIFSNFLAIQKPDKFEIFSIDKKHMSIKMKTNSYLIIFREK